MKVNGALVPSSQMLAAGCDYTLLVYVDSANNPKTSFLLDNNTAPVLATGVKYRLINLAHVIGLKN